MAIQQFRVRSGLLTDALVKFNSKATASADGNSDTSSAINNTTTITNGSDPGEILVLDAANQVAYRTAAQLKADLDIALTLSQGKGIAFHTGGTQQDSITFGSSAQTIEIESPATLSVTSAQNKGTAGSGASAGVGHSHEITTSSDVSGGSQAILASTGAGALSVAALSATSAQISGGLTVTGDLTVSGTTTTVSSTNTTITDPLLVLNKGGTSGAATVDSGLLFEGASDANAAIIYSQNESEFQMFKTNAKDDTVTFGADAGFNDKTYTASGLRVNKLTLVEAKPGVALVSPGIVNVTADTTSTSATTGAIVTAGGLGVGGAAFVGGNITGAGLLTSGSGTLSTSASTGSIQSSGGIGVGKDSYFGAQVKIDGATRALEVTGMVNVASTTAATKASGSADAAALMVAGGVGINNNLIVKEPVEFLKSTTSLTTQGKIIVEDTTASTSSSSGSVQLSGGMGVAGSIFSGGGVVSGGVLTAGATTDNPASKVATSAGGFSASGLLNGGLAVKKSAVVGTDLFVYSRLHMQDKAWATAGTGTVNSVIMQPFKSSAIAHTGTGDPVVILDKTEFTTAEILFTARGANNTEFFSGKALVMCDGSSSLTHTIYAEMFNGTEPTDHAFTVATTNSTGGSGSGYVSLKYNHGNSSTTYTFSGVATLSATQTI